MLSLTLVFPAFASAPRQYTIEVDGLELQLVTLPPGSFMMGSESGGGDEKPVHKVTIDYSFDIGRTEVTVGQFKEFAEATGHKTDAELHAGAWHCPCPDRLGYARGRNWHDPGFDQTDEYPVVCVSYNDAKAFCEWLSEQSGQYFRLPTEAEWEYACRAGTTGDYAGDLHEMAWFDMTSSDGTLRVASKRPNGWGLCDMHGNVWEWCQDIYHWHYRDAPADGSANTNPDVPAEAASRRVLRGGAWCRPKTSCTSSSRFGAHSTFRETGTGFRIVRCTELPTDKTEPALPKPGKPGKSSENDVAAPPQVVLTVGDVEFSFVRIDPGKFVMGSDHVDVDQYGWTYELPAHEVAIDYTCYMAATEVTLEQFDLFVTDTGYVTDAEKHGFAFVADDTGWHYVILHDWRFCGYAQTDTEPVTHICWYDAIAFCRWLSEKTGRNIRLPSEAEWEYACRAGTTGDYAGNLDEMGWCLWNSQPRTYPVAQKKPNPWGLCDMHGNVWEWVLDLWNPETDGAPTDGSPWLTSPRLDPPGVVRGGSFANPPWLLRSNTRMRTPLGHRAHFNNGFRLAMSLD